MSTWLPSGVWRGYSHTSVSPATKYCLQKGEDGCAPVQRAAVLLHDNGHQRAFKLRVVGVEANQRFGVAGAGVFMPLGVEAFKVGHSGLSFGFGFSGCLWARADAVIAQCGSSLFRKKNYFECSLSSKPITLSLYWLNSVKSSDKTICNSTASLTHAISSSFSDNESCKSSTE